MIILLLISFFTALAISWLSIPSIVKVANEKHLYDEPDEKRKIHQHNIPSLGGIAIFGGVIITCTFFVNFTALPQWGYAISAIVLMFFTGVKDDIIPLSASKKFLAQLVASAIVVMKSDIRLTQFYGFLWIDGIDYYTSVTISIFTLLTIINAFNLLDGINGLAGGVGMIASLMFAYFFYVFNSPEWAIIAVSLAGSLAGFLYYNLRRRAMIFMGDTGSLLIGLFLAIFAIVFIELNREAFQAGKAFAFKPPFAPVLAISILLLPLFDTLRVFCIRIANKRSPFSGDRNHLHHYLVDSGLTHPFASIILYVAHISFVLFILLFMNLPQVLALSTLFLLALGFSLGLYYFKLKKLTSKNIKTPLETAK